MNGLAPPMAHTGLTAIPVHGSSMGSMASVAASSLRLGHYHPQHLAAHVAAAAGGATLVVGGLHHSATSHHSGHHSASHAAGNSSSSGSSQANGGSHLNGHSSNHSHGHSHPEAAVDIPQEVVPSLAHIPLKSYMIKDFPFNINCKGCNKAFPCYYTPKGFKKIPAPAYYVHCIDDCPEYRAKGFIKECEVCSFKFLDKQSLGIHKNSCRATNKRAMLAKKPKWMPYSILLTIINYSKFDGRIDCRGCKRKFPCYRNGTKVVPSLEYYVHCIEECKEYRDKGWIQKCSQCKCKFLNTISLIQHMKGCFK